MSLLTKCTEIPTFPYSLQLEMSFECLISINVSLKYLYIFSNTYCLLFRLFLCELHTHFLFVFYFPQNLLKYYQY